MDEMSVYSTDSTTAKAYISKVYGKEPKLARRVAEVWKFMEEFSLMQIPVLLSQKEIESSDHLSRLSDKFDFTVPTPLFNKWCKTFQIAPSIDLFATRFSAKTARFCCIKKDPQAIALDAFSIPWQGEIAYAFPPAHLLHRTISKAEEEDVPLLIVHPLIKGSSWFHRIKKLAVKPISIQPGQLIYPAKDLAPQYRWKIL
mmetsp:Transcript_14718/g.20547  ORF Transcript_14718/g.20547 Transcript_14718/m.20547 type:complete len:200 (+) Transcript_14718:1704-2303(+)